MRGFAIAAASALALASFPALAQSSDDASQQGKSAQQQPKIQAMTQDKLRQNLESAGFSDVTILDATYLVRASTEDGQDVMMFINPPGTATGGSQASGGGQSGSGSSDAEGQQQSSN
jgi:hypothetical protein